MLRQFLKTWQVLVTPIVSQELSSSRLKMFDFLALWNFLAWLGLFGLAWTFWSGWDFLVWLGLLAWTGLLGLAWSSWPGWDFLAFLGLLDLRKNFLVRLTLLGLAGTSWPGWDFLASLGLLGNWWNKLKLGCLYTPIMLKFEIWNMKYEIGFGAWEHLFFHTFKYEIWNLKLLTFKFQHYWCI